MKKSLGAKPMAFPTPVWVIGTYDKEGRPNVMTVAWGGVCCSKPPSVTISLRKATYSYQSILDRKAYTVNIPSEQFAVEADYFGSVSARDEDKFAATGLTPIRSDHVDAPYVAEFPCVLECKVTHIHEIGMHTQFIGEIINIMADEAILGKNGLPDVGKLKPFTYAPQVGTYFALGQDLGKAYNIGKKFRTKPTTD
jgi:flavin reductase (DIM6/NTAB) family NADH-FMN oxidoreductase RutF